jgi:isochorismate synthase
VGKQPYFLWEQPERDLGFWAFGEAARIEASGPDRFAQAREGIDRVLAEAVAEGTTADVAAPVFLAGFAFDTANSGDGRWAAFPDALVIAPRILISRRDGKQTLTLNLRINRDTDLEAALAGLRNEVLDLVCDKPRRQRPVSSVSAVQADADRDAWHDSVHSLTDQIARERVAKVVLARHLEIASSQPFDINAALERLRERYRNCTLFAVGRGDSCFLGATPELLVQRQGEQVRADCLAGSAPRGRSAAEDEAYGAALLADDKERREHALVAQGLLESLTPLCDEVRVGEASGLRKMANVQHLYTPIEAKAQAGRHILEFVERLHPTPAVAGLPRERSLCLIREQERFNRGWYAGPIGWLDSNGDGEFAVALRSALVQGDRALLYAGCGIVAGSDPEREYEESRIKLEAMRWALGGTN